MSVRKEVVTWADTQKDLHVAATDRIAECHWFICGALQEISIAALLVIEIVLMFAELYSVYIR